MRILAALAFSLTASLAQAQTMEPREGWTVIATQKPYQQLIDDVKSATKANKMGVVTEAGPTQAAAKRGVTIPGNRVIGVFNNAFAVDILALSTAAMIEAPLRFYVTESAGGQATLAWKHPTAVFAPYLDEGGEALRDLAAELDDRFAAIADMAVN
ncbi:DUF302 domain-containing protein [Aestuariivita sp.]|jgi:uncharacterized protein (DUF302 family)|uniref:DUF302 domain-containing protein n=1 Tax=Aestuariivita sp. TaxID=1872407 RepID=UPI00216D3747|nr:DUF302 domain-containing protein [Aestuariivita sp.]MCE8005690.1 DUF302 domain-containing protein [Aestuariivita sp.]